MVKKETKESLKSNSNKQHAVISVNSVNTLSEYERLGTKKGKNHRVTIYSGYYSRRKLEKN